MEKEIEVERAYINGKEIGGVTSATINMDDSIPTDKYGEDLKAFGKAARNFQMTLVAEITPAFKKFLLIMEALLAAMESPSRRGRRIQAWKRGKGRK